MTTLAVGIAAIPQPKANAEPTVTSIAIDIAVTAAKIYWNDVGQYIQACNSASRAREGQRVIREVGEALRTERRRRRAIRLAEWKNASSMQKRCFYALANPQLQRDVARLESLLQEQSTSIPITYVNRSSHTLAVAIRWKEPGGNYRTRGWWALDPGQQHTLGQSIGKYIYVHARTRDGRKVWGGDYRLCIDYNTTQPFNWRKKECSQMTGFRRIKVEGRRSLTYTFND